MVHSTIIRAAALVSAIVVCAGDLAFSLVQLLTFWTFAGTTVDGLTTGSSPASPEKVVAVSNGPGEGSQATAEKPAVHRTTVGGFAQVRIAAIVPAKLLIAGGNTLVINTIKTPRTGALRQRGLTKIPGPLGVPTVRGNGASQIAGIAYRGIADIRWAEVSRRTIRGAPIEHTRFGPTPKSSIVIGRDFANVQESVGVQAMVVHVVVEGRSSGNEAIDP